MSKLDPMGKTQTFLSQLGSVTAVCCGGGGCELLMRGKRSTIATSIVAVVLWRGITRYRGVMVARHNPSLEITVRSGDGDEGRCEHGGWFRSVV